MKGLDTIKYFGHIKGITPKATRLSQEYFMLDVLASPLHCRLIVWGLQSVSLNCLHMLYIPTSDVLFIANARQIYLTSCLALFVPFSVP